MAAHGSHDGHMMNMSHMSSTVPSTTMPHMGHGMGSTTMDMSGGHNHGPMDMNDSDATCRGEMMMYFHTGKCEFVLFEQLRTSSVGEMVGACVAIFFLAMLYEGLKVFREYLLRRAMTQNKYVSKGSNTSSQDAMVIEGKQIGNGFESNGKGAMATHGTDDGCCSGVKMLSGVHFVQTLLHMVQVFISYCLMLVFMTYNAWLCIAVIVGAGLGYFLFGWTKSIVVDMNEHCH